MYVVALKPLEEGQDENVLTTTWESGGRKRVQDCYKLIDASFPNHCSCSTIK